MRISRHIGIGLAWVLFACLAEAQGTGTWADISISLDIPAQPLQQALNEFARQTGLQVLIRDKDVAPGLVSPAIHGTFSLEAGLQALLTNSGLKYSRINERTVGIQALKPIADVSAGSTSAWHLAQAAQTDDPAVDLQLSQAESSSAPTATDAGAAKDPENPGKDSTTHLEEIVVTAQKRTQSLQEVPISVQVVNGQVMAERNNTALEDLARTLPGVNITSRSGSNLITIRGIGSGENLAFDQSVAMFTDDIYHGRSRMSLGAFLDLDRIEVLKGPQGTFFGNNAVAGALNIVSKKPGNVFDASARALYGQFGQYALEGAIGGPITDSFGARLAVTRNGDDRGWLDNVNTGGHLPVINNEAARLTLDYHPGDLRATFKIEGSKHGTSGSADELPEQMTNCPPPAPLPPSYTFNGAPCATALAQGLPVGIKSDQTFGPAGEGNSLSTFEDVLTLDYRHWNQTFTSVTGFYSYHFDSQGDASQLPMADTAVTLIFPEKYHQFSQEFRVASPTDQPIEYMAGAYFQTDQLDHGAQLYLPLFNALGPDLGIPAGDLPLADKTPFSQMERVYSVFGSVTWKVTSRLQVNAGLRGSRVTKHAEIGKEYGVATGFFCCFAPVPQDVAARWIPILGATGTTLGSQSNDQLMPSAGIQYQLNPQAMAYFHFERGFKAGGFAPNFGAIGGNAYGPEHVDAYELGFKSKWFDDTLLLNADIFRMNYQGLQQTSNFRDPQTGIFGSRVGNAAGAVSQGAELETQWVASDHLRVSANITYLDSHFTDYKNAPASLSDLQTYCSGLNAATFAATAQCGIYSYPVSRDLDLTGQQTPYAPRWTGTVGGSYSVPVRGEYRLTTELSSYFSSSFNHEVPDLPGVFNNGYMRLDARISLESPDGRWAFDVIGKNLTDRLIIVFPTLGFQSKEQPRNVAAQVRFHW